MKRAELGKTFAVIGCKSARGGIRSYQGLMEAEVPVYGNIRDTVAHAVSVTPRVLGTFEAPVCTVYSTLAPRRQSFHL